MPIGTKRHRILVVDDDTKSRSALVSAILSLGYCILEAPDGQQGYEKFRAEHADLVVSADAMPGFSGVEMVRKIRETDSEVPVLFLKRNGLDALEDEAGRLGNCKVLREPFYPRQFRSFVEAALNGRRERDGLRRQN